MFLIAGDMFTWLMADTTSFFSSSLWTLFQLDPSCLSVVLSTFTATRALILDFFLCSSWSIPPYPPPLFSSSLIYNHNIPRQKDWSICCLKEVASRNGLAGRICCLPSLLFSLPKRGSFSPFDISLCSTLIL